MLELEKDKLFKIYSDGLLKDVVPFWEKYSIDKEYGGFLTLLDADGKVYCSDKPMWIIGRETWLFSWLYNKLEKRDEWLRLAKHGIDFIRKFGFDSDGRMFYLVTRDGKPLRKRRYLFTETFGVIALAEYAKATGQQQALDEAKELYKLILKYHNGDLLEPKFFSDTRKMKAHAMPMILLAISQVLREVDRDPLYEEVINSAIQEVFDDFVKPDFKALLETVGPKGEFIDQPQGREVNPGHAIETAWFIMEEARKRDDTKLAEKACQILDWSLDIGWDSEYGGIYYFRDIKGYPCMQYEHDMKLWWPHAEAIYATLLAYYLTGQEKYICWHKKIHDWTYSHFPDLEFGEWFGYLHRDGTVSTTIKGSFWKGPFHIPRMQLKSMKLLEEINSKKIE